MSLCSDVYQIHVSVPYVVNLMQILSLLILKGVLYFSMCLKIWHPPRWMPFIIVIQFSLRSSADESREYNS